MSPIAYYQNQATELLTVDRSVWHATLVEVGSSKASRYTTVERPVPRVDLYVVDLAVDYDLATVANSVRLDEMHSFTLPPAPDPIVKSILDKGGSTVVRVLVRPPAHNPGGTPEQAALSTLIAALLGCDAWDLDKEISRVSESDKG